MITLKYRNEFKNLVPSVMTDREIEMYIDYCEQSIITIQTQVEENRKCVARGNPGRGDEWISAVNRSLEQYLLASGELKSALAIKHGNGEEYADVFMKVARELLLPELYTRISDAAQDRLVG